MIPPQPVKGVLASRRITVAELARRIGFPYKHTYHAVNADAEPTAAFRGAVAAALALPEDALFRRPVDKWHLKPYDHESAPTFSILRPNRKYRLHPSKFLEDVESGEIVLPDTDFA
ncbi:MAG: hypothetical protein ACR2M4_02350 [Actinomycetota bacterium]